MLRGRAADHSANRRSSRNPAGRHRNNATVCGSYYGDRRPDSCANSNVHTATYAHYHPCAATNGNTDSYPHSYYAASGNACHTADDGNAATHAYGHSRIYAAADNTNSRTRRQAYGDTPANGNASSYGCSNAHYHTPAGTDGLHTRTQRPCRRNEVL